MTSLAEFQLASGGEDASMEQFLLHRRQFGDPNKLVQLVDKAVMNFTAVGEDIAAENPDFQVGSSDSDCMQGAPPPFPLCKLQLNFLQNVMI